MAICLALVGGERFAFSIKNKILWCVVWCGVVIKKKLKTIKAINKNK
jgi:hypothetical protein